MKDVPNPAPASKPRPVVYLKWGRGGKVERGGRGHGRGHGCAPAADVSHACDHDDNVVSTARDDDVLSTSSGQTTTGSEKD